LTKAGPKPIACSPNDGQLLILPKTATDQKQQLVGRDNRCVSMQKASKMVKKIGNRVFSSSIVSSSSNPLSEPKCPF
ncbi:MAG: hypothetical protein AAGD05_13990, partial [Bacteroidota bacterium]